MKKLFIILLFFFSMTTIYAEKISVEFADCVDGDTAKFIYNSEKITARFLNVDTPETVNTKVETQEYGKEASDYTCKRIKEAKQITLEFDEKSKKNDLYGRYLVWVFIDNNLLQKELIEKGFAKIDERYDNYKYSKELKKLEEKTKQNKLGIWNDGLDENKNELKKAEENKEESNKIIVFFEKYKSYIILVGALIITSAFDLKQKNKIKSKLKSKLKKDIKKRLK